mgnify:CR=1 FL=1
MEKKINYKINEIFYSIQGEGYNTGVASVFIRFSGCNLSCDFCDTWHIDYTEMDKEEIFAAISVYPCKNILLTGGEPTYQTELAKLVKFFKDNGYRIAMETNGTGKVPEEIDWVTVSPKTKDYLKNGNELKLIYTGQNDDELSSFLKTDFQHYFLQPRSMENIAETIEAVKRNPVWKLSVQVHKLIGIK